MHPWADIPKLVLNERGEARSVARGGPTTYSIAVGPVTRPRAASADALSRVDFWGCVPKTHTLAQMILRQIARAATRPSALENPSTAVTAGSRNQNAGAIGRGSRA